MRNADLRLLLLFAALIAALFLKHVPLALPDVRATNAPREFDVRRAVERLARILGDEKPHPVDTDENDAVRERLLAEIEAMGFAPEVRDDFSCREMPERGRVVCARVRNVLFRAGPVGGDAVMIASHYDSVPAGPGAADDGIGVAVSLELAKLLADAPPAKPVVFLITDGEEMGLIGAHSFVTADPVASDITAVVNLEARGVRGPAQMFQTSVPNSADVAAFVEGARRPFSNSMMTDIYRLLPNDTDVTEFLPMGYDAINFALTEGVELYHTPLDNLSHLDRRSVQHMGDNALGAVRNLLEAGGPRETQVIFSDVLSRMVVVLPQWLGGVALGLGLVIAGFAFMRDPGARPIRAFLTPPAILVLGGAATYGLQFAIGAIRPQAQYWMAYPQAMQGVAYFSAACAAAITLRFVAAGAGGGRLLHAGWFWFAALGAGSFIVAPGASILFAPPLALYAVGVFAESTAPWLRRPVTLMAAVLVLIIFAPALLLSEIGLGFGAAAIFAVVAAIILIVAAPLALDGSRRVGSAAVLLSAFGLALSAGAATAVPAYSALKPQPLNIQYYVDVDTGDARWLLSTPDSRPPEPLRAVAAFADHDVEGLGRRLGAPAPFLDARPPDLVMLGEDASSEGRRIRFAISANGADQILIRIPSDAGALGITQAGREAAFGPAGAQTLVCAGRACDGAEFEIMLREPAPADWLVFGIQFGLPYEAWPLVNARPARSTAIQNGDVTIVRAKKTV